MLGKIDRIAKVMKTVLLLSAFAAIALFCSACSSSSLSYLSAEQNDMLNSVRPVAGTDNKAFEIDYTADYKMDEFIQSVARDTAYPSLGCRMTMKNLLADGSNILPIGRLSNYAPGCSSVMCKTPDGASVIGRNYDLDVRSNGAVVVIHTAPENGFKSVGVADCGQCGLACTDVAYNTPSKELLLYAPYFTMDGVNEKGFACSIMLLNEGANVQDTGKSWLPSTLVVRYLLDHASSVESAIDLLEDMDLRNDYLIEPFLADVSFHWALSDVAGEKAVIEYIDGKMVVNRYPLKVAYDETDNSLQVSYPKEERGYLISTNFYVSEGFENTAHDSGRWRYETLEKELSENSTPSTSQLRDIMKSAKYFMNDKDYLFELKEQGVDPADPAKWDWITIWTDILNTADKTLTLWVMEDYEVENVFGLEY